MWSRSTASFSAAISTSVSPRYSVCSRPTEVSTVTREGSTLVASRRPAEPGLDHPDLDPGGGEGDEGGRGVGLELGHRLALGSSVRSTVSTAWATRSTAAANAAGSISAPRIRTRSRQRSSWGET